MNNDRIDRLEQYAVHLAVRWAKTGIAYNSMVSAVNDYMEAIGANRAIDDNPEVIRLGREIAALRIDVGSIYALTKEQEQRLHDTLLKIAADGVPQQRRGMRR